MKNLLIATTALVATATVAAADVSFSGYGRFGVKYDEATSETTNVSRLRVQIDATGTSDNGLSFSARTRITPEENATGVVNGARYTVSAGGFTLAMGNIFGAIDGMVGVYDSSKSAGIGLEGNGFVSLPVMGTDATCTGTANACGFDGYSNGGAGPSNAIEAIYSAGAFGMHVSYSKDSRTAANVSYSAGGLTVAAGMQNSEINAEDLTVVTAMYDLGTASFGLLYSDADAGGKTTVVRASTSMGGATVYGFYGDNDLAASTDNAYGVAVSYGLGGGTSFEAGVGSDYTGNTTADAGFFFSF